MTQTGQDRPTPPAPPGTAPAADGAPISPARPDSSSATSESLKRPQSPKHSEASEPHESAEFQASPESQASRMQYGRLTRRAEYLAVAATGRKWITPAFILQAKPGTTGTETDKRPDGQSDPRPDPHAGGQAGTPAGGVCIGFTVSRKVGKAVVRNRARRRLKDAVRAVLPRHAVPGWDYVLVGRPAAVTYPFERLQSDLKWALRKLAAGADLKKTAGKRPSGGAGRTGGQNPPANKRAAKKRPTTGNGPKKNRDTAPTGHGAPGTGTDDRAADKAVDKTASETGNRHDACCCQAGQNRANRPAGAAGAGKNDAPLSLAARGAVLLIRGYQLVLSPLLGPNCRFQPTCSQYALEAVRLHGGLKGSWLAIRRVMRCHPWGGHGYDPVPPHGVTGHKKTPKGEHAGKQGRTARENN